MTSKPYRWQSWEREELELLYPTMNSTEIAACLGRSVIAVRRQATRMQLDCGARWGKETRVWTMADEAKLRKLWSEGLSVRIIAARLNHTESSVRAHRLRLALPRRHDRKQADKKQTAIHPWRKKVSA